jgi:PmbA protein
MKGSDAADADGWLADLPRRAQALGALEAEVFRKTAHGRRVMLEPALVGGARPRLTVSTSEEDGLAVRVKDRQGRWGFAWGSPSGPRAALDLVAAALASARSADPEIPLAPPRRRDAEGEASPASAEGPADLGIDDAEGLSAPVDRVADLLGEAAEAATSHAGGAAAVDRALLSAAGGSVTLFNSCGFSGSYGKSLALLSLSMAPVASGAVAALEERSACRLRDLDPRECGREAARRALPPRPPVPPPAGEPPLLLEPRAAASLLSTLLPRLMTGAIASPGALWIVDDGRLPGGFGTAPFDGIGRPTRRATLVAGGLAAGRLSSIAGNVVRPSFRDPPAAGFTNLYASPASEVGRLLADPLLDPIEERMLGGVADGPEPCLRASAVRFIPGPAWRVRILSGNWHSGGSPAGSADGIGWEGPLETILAGIRAAGSDLRFFHLGMPIGAPSLRIEGLGPWVVESAGARPAAVPPRPRPDLGPVAGA